MLVCTGQDLADQNTTSGQEDAAVVIQYLTVTVPVFVPTSNPNETWGFGPDMAECTDGRLACYVPETHTKWWAPLIPFASAQFWMCALDLAHYMGSLQHLNSAEG